jgi:hypothetical protein
MTRRAHIAVAALACFAAAPAVSAAQGVRDPDVEPLFAQVWMGGPLDSIYNAEYQRVQTVAVWGVRVRLSLQHGAANREPLHRARLFGGAASSLVLWDER